MGGDDKSTTFTAGSIGTWILADNLMPNHHLLIVFALVVHLSRISGYRTGTNKSLKKSSVGKMN